MSVLTAADRVQETAQSVGASTTITLLGAAALGLRTFAAAGLDGELVPYVIEHTTSGQWEVGEGEYVQSGAILHRTMVYANSAGTTVPLDFALGLVEVWVDLPAAKAVMLDADSAHLTLPAGLTIAGQLDGVTVLDVNTLNVATSLLPTTDNAASLGSASKRWSDLRTLTATISGLLSGAAATFSGLLTAAAGATISAAQTLALAGALVSGAPTWGSAQAITLSTASQPNITAATALVSVGALASGSIAAGFGTINNAGNGLTTGAVSATSGSFAGAVAPLSDNLYALGTASFRWSDVRGVTATFTTVTGALSGNAATATALQNARTINGVSFDGTANITVPAAAGTLTGGTLAAGVTASSLTSVGTLAALTVTATITGSVSGSSGSSTGNAATATALQNARTINGVSFDGTANITVPAAAPFALTAGTHLAGGPYDGSAAVTLTTDATNANTASTIIARDASGNFSAGMITAALTGNASTATALATGRAINGVTFDGTAPITITATASHALTLGTGLSGTSYDGSGAVTANVTGAPASGITGTTLAASVVTSSLTTIGTLVGGAVPASLITAGTFGAGAYTFPSTLGVGGSLNLSAAVNFVAAATQAAGSIAYNATDGIVIIGKAGSVRGLTVLNEASNVIFDTLTGTVNAVFGGTLTASNLSGTNTGDQTSVSGNAATATALQTARAINGVNFDGTAPITVTAAASTLTGTTMAAVVTASSLTSFGTLAANLLFVDATYDIGASGATRPRNIFASGTITGTTLAGTLSTAAQGNITSVGTLTSLAVSGGITMSGVGILLIPLGCTVAIHASAVTFDGLPTSAGTAGSLWVDTTGGLNIVKRA